MSAPRPTSAFTAATWPLSAAQCKGVFPCGGRGASRAVRRVSRVMRERSETRTPGGRAGHGTRRRCLPTHGPRLSLPSTPPRASRPGDSSSSGAARRAPKHPDPPPHSHAVRPVDAGGGERGETGREGQGMKCGAGGQLGLLLRCCVARLSLKSGIKGIPPHKDVLCTFRIPYGVGWYISSHYD